MRRSWINTNGLGILKNAGGNLRNRSTHFDQPRSSICRVNRSIQVRASPLADADSEKDVELASSLSLLSKPSKGVSLTGDVVSGVVQAVKPFGAFVDIGGATGLLHISQISHSRITDVGKIVSVGDRLKVMILKTDQERGCMMLSTKKFEREPGDMVRNPQQVFDGAEEMAQLFMERLERINLAQLELEDTFMGSAEYSIDGLLDSMDWREVPPLAAAMAGNSMANTRAPASAGQLLGVKVGDVVTGIVQSVLPYGAFVDLGGVTGLLHVSQISHGRIDNLAKILSEGDQLKVMIISADPEWQRISLSTKKLEKNPGDMVRDKQLVFDSAEEMAKVFKERLEGITRGPGVRSVDGLLNTMDE